MTLIALSVLFIVPTILGGPVYRQGKMQFLKKVTPKLHIILELYE